jgi:amidohydrolase
MEELIKIRRHLHANPELSGHEKDTSQYIYDYLKSTKANQVIRVAKTGVVAIFESGKSGETTAIRADIDALPIQEVNTFEHKSKKKNICHKCGHDGHTAILLGVANALSQHPIKKGRVVLLFQPSEENGEGAKSILASSTFKELSIHRFFALHNLPGFPLQEIVIKEGVFTANVISVKVEITGKTAHAAEPEMGRNPSLAIAKILEHANSRVKKDASSTNFFLITPVFVQVGERAFGISAGRGEVHFTLRSWDKELLDEYCEKFTDYIQDVCSSEELESKITWLEEFESNYNKAEAVEVIRSAAKELGLNTTALKTPFKWGEDFGLFTKKYNGAMFGIGAGVNSPALHNSDYDFPDQIIAPAVKMFHQIIKKIHE